MHLTSRLKFESFLATYLAEAGVSEGKRILDIGSRVVLDHGYSYREATTAYGLDYVGLDMEAGKNVDIVPANPYSWDEIPDDSFDYVVSGQALEHDPFFWVTFCQIARVLKPGGLACIIAPSAGPVHRWPLDCWRFYPDSWSALCALSGLLVRETIREPAPGKLAIDGTEFADSAVIASKPVLTEPDSRDAYAARINALVAPFRLNRIDVSPAEENAGICFEHYLKRLRHRARRKRQRAEARRARRAPPDP